VQVMIMCSIGVLVLDISIAIDRSEANYDVISYAMKLSVCLWLHTGNDAAHQSNSRYDRV